MKAAFVFKKLNRLLAGVSLVVISLLISAPFYARAALRGVYVGGEFYPPINKVAATKASGFNTLFLFTLRIYANGDLYYNDTPVVLNGVYVGDPSFNLVATNGTGPASIPVGNAFYRNATP